MDSFICMILTAVWGKLKVKWTFGEGEADGIDVDWG